ncbi:hypothetical protein [Tomitella fengzijianii]|uniref:Uncharacterized protein n=1 Tax=Tomitella fengzijianii TaxID=2597660 RepID=A0A516X4I4_9ACTN|nr:hypothetical protein [Tomitella fengzijianii]QDQ97960.1 hypothetical protein FO059_12355 [Tomitella fengzijianii]
MEWVALSSKYYIDLDDDGISERAEVLLTRALAYMSDNETSGHLPKAALKRLGLSSVYRRVTELLDAGIMVVSQDSLGHEIGYDFPAWSKWNAPLERQVRKKKADRERIAAKRRKDSNVARQSRGQSRDVAAPQNRDSSLSTYVERATHQGDAREREEQPRGPAVSVDGWKLVRAAIPDEHPQASRTALALHAGQLLKSGTPADDISAALTLWLSKPHLGPGTLPSLVSEVIRQRVTPARQQLDAATAKVAGWADLANQLNAQEACK